MSGMAGPGFLTAEPYGYFEESRVSPSFHKVGFSLFYQTII